MQPSYLSKLGGLDKFPALILFQAGELDKLAALILVLARGLDKLATLLLVRATTLDTKQPLSPTSWLEAWGAYVLSGVHKMNMASDVVL